MTSATAESTLQALAPSAEWLQCLELGYDDDEKDKLLRENPICFHCGKSDSTLSRCGKCNVAAYCSRDCQVKDWKGGTGGGHKFSCEAYARVGPQMKLSNTEDQATARRELFGRIRFYACPYVVYKESTLGKGFLFVQSECTLAELSLPVPKGSDGRQLRQTRSVLLHFLTVGEYDSEVCRDDFELTTVRSKLQDAVASYDAQTTVVLLMRFRCGHVALGTTCLVPDYSICKSLGKDYFSESSAGALQLNLDDM